MERLQSELGRLYGPTGGKEARGLVLELTGPGAWQELAKVWQGVQAELGWPAPGIAVSGDDAFQLWFSLAQPVPAAEAQAGLEALRARYLADAAPARVRTKTFDGQAPPQQHGTDRWSAFVTPDLVSMFSEEPWLDLPPGADAQADLLATLRSVPPAEWQRALRPEAPAREGAPAAAPLGAPASAPEAAPSRDPRRDPRRFLLDVMNDPGVEMRLRIEAAKALLPYFDAAAG